MHFKADFSSAKLTLPSKVLNKTFLFSFSSQDLYLIRYSTQLYSECNL